MSKKQSKGNSGLLIFGVVAALVAAVISLVARNAKGKQQYEQLVGAIQQIIAEGRAKAETAAEVISERGEELAKDVKRRAEQRRSE
jgi:hypothetical protein